MNKKMTLRSRFILTSYLSIVFSVVLICLVSYVLLSRNSRKYAVQAGHEAVRQSRRLWGAETGQGTKRAVLEGLWTI